MTRHTRIKICGITRIQDALDAVALGADALGFVFVPKSPRHVTIDQVAAILPELPPFVTTVGLFMDHSHEQVAKVLDVLPLNVLQFHGEESPEFCEGFAHPYIKAVPMGEDTDPIVYAKAYSRSLGFLLDSHAVGQIGGSGETFDWSKIPQGFPRSLILAGGLDANNVKSAVVDVKPYAVDVSSGVEAAKGIKDAKKMAAFIQAVKEGDRVNANAAR